METNSSLVYPKIHLNIFTDNTNRINNEYMNGFGSLGFMFFETMDVSDITKYENIIFILKSKEPNLNCQRCQYSLYIHNSSSAYIIY